MENLLQNFASGLWIVLGVYRCKACKHRFKDSWCEYVDDDDNFYCARGERKEGADNG